MLKPHAVKTPYAVHIKILKILLQPLDLFLDGPDSFLRDIEEGDTEKIPFRIWTRQKAESIRFVFLGLGTLDHVTLD